MKKTIFITILMFTLLCAAHAYAAEVVFHPSKDSVDIGEQFYVDVMLDPHNVSINGIEGKISFDDNLLSFVRAEEGKSLVTLWIQKPNIDGNSISFAGIVPTGFSGVIDPFNSSIKKPGIIIRLVFEAKLSGQAFVRAEPFSITQNDGEGTADNTMDTNISINISNTKSVFIYKSPTDVAPTLNAYVTRDENLFDNKYALIFQATDKESGIDSVMVKEGNHDWKKAGSPYLLEDQSRHSTIVVRATNFSGDNFSVTIDAIPYNPFSLSGLILLVALIITALYIIRRKYVFKK